jgi:hypothetical protein
MLKNPSPVPLASTLRAILLSLSSASALAACGGQIAGSDGGTSQDAAAGDAGRDAKADAGSCTVVVVEPGDPNGCGDRVVEIVGTPELCGVPSPDAGTGIEQPTCQRLCERQTVVACYWSSETQITCTDCAVGRAPAGLAPAEQPAAPGLGGWFAEMARLEAAAVIAFERLAGELEAHGAPRELIKRARRAAEDEVRHAEMTRELAARFGGAFEEPRATLGPVRDLEAIARENAIEGCVRETYGALVAMWQAAHAKDQAVRAAIAEIAEDEISHAELSWELACWIEPRLDSAARARVDAARVDAAARLRASAALVPDRALVAIAGMPGAREAAALVDALQRELWSSAA